MHDVLGSTSSSAHARQLVWFSWLLGAAVLGALVAGVLQLSDASHFELLLSQAEPGWLLLAIALQGLTYIAQGQLYRMVLKASGATLPLWMRRSSAWPNCSSTRRYPRRGSAAQ